MWGLPVDSQILPAVQHHYGIIKRRAVPLVNADRKDHRKLLRDQGESLHRFILLHGLCEPVIPVLPLLTEILPFKELRQKDELCPLRRGVPDHLLRFSEIPDRVSAAAHLHCGDFHICHVVLTFSLPPHLSAGSAG